MRLAMNIQLVPRLIICESDPYLSNVDINSIVFPVAPVPLSRSTRHFICNVLCWYLLCFCHVVMAGKMVGLRGNFLFNFRAETSPISDEQSSLINTYQYHLLVPTNAHILIHVCVTLSGSHMFRLVAILSARR